jgi:hypothetical protein
MFVFPGQQPLRFRDPAFQTIPGNSFTFLVDCIKEFKKAGLDFSAYVQRFDYVVVHGTNDGDELELLPAKSFTLINRADDYRLYRVSGKTTPSAGLSELQ